MQRRVLAILVLLGSVAAHAQRGPAAPGTTAPATRPAVASPYSYAWDPAVLTLLRGTFNWKLSAPLLDAQADRGMQENYVRQPAAVFFKQQWQVFVVTRRAGGKHQIEYLQTPKLEAMQQAQRVALGLEGLDASAPQVFYFAPKKQWFLVFQAFDAKRHPARRPMYATSEDPTDPAGWSKPEEIKIPYPRFAGLWGDFWVICDEEDAFLFYTTRDGRVLRCRTPLEEFPQGFNPPLRSVQGDFISGARVYRVKKLRRYLLIVESQDLGRRYTRAYINTRLDGGWDALAASVDKPFAGEANVARDWGTPAWTDTFAEAQLLRDGIDQTQEVDPKDFRILFSGCSELDRAGKGPGAIPWKVGLLEPAGRADALQNAPGAGTGR